MSASPTAFQAASKQPYKLSCRLGMKSVGKIGRIISASYLPCPKLGCHFALGVLSAWWLGVWWESTGTVRGLRVDDFFSGSFLGKPAPNKKNNSESRSRPTQSPFGTNILLFLLRNPGEESYCSEAEASGCVSRAAMPRVLSGTTRSGTASQLQGTGVTPHPRVSNVNFSVRSHQCPTGNGKNENKDRRRRAARSAIVCVWEMQFSALRSSIQSMLSTDGPTPHPVVRKKTLRRSSRRLYVSYV